MTAPIPFDRWNARLSLGFEARASRTTLARNEHIGPLVVQKALHPEGDVCQAVVLHPPGGIAGGDHLSIEIHAATNAFAQLTTPGATKWYKANGRAASQDVRIDVDDAGIVEWLPLENIVFDGAVASSSLVVDVSGSACAAGWDIVAYGRSARGERFDTGHYRQSIELKRDGRLLWAESGAVRGDDPLLRSAVGFGGRAVCGLLWAMTQPGSVDEATLDACRAQAAATTRSLEVGVTSLEGGIVLARCLADSPEEARGWLMDAWRALRPVYARRVAVMPRLWLT